MMERNWRRVPPMLRVFSLLAGAGLLTGVWTLGGGCGALNPSFVDYALPEGFQTTQNATGHIPIFFENETQFSTPTLEFLDSVGVDISDPNIRPRVRVVAEIRFTDGTTRILEFIDGTTITELTTDGILPPDLTSPPLTNQVLQCDVSAISIEPENIQIYIPVPLVEWTYEEVEDDLIPVIDGTFDPVFWALEADEVDEFLNPTVINNFDIRDAPAPVVDVRCGSVVMFVLQGTLDVPFTRGVPGWYDDDTAAERRFPGRFEMITTVR